MSNHYLLNVPILCPLKSEIANLFHKPGFSEQGLANPKVNP